MNRIISMNYDNDYLHRRWSFFRVHETTTTTTRNKRKEEKAYLLDAQCVRAGLRNSMSNGSQGH